VLNEEIETRILVTDARTIALYTSSTAMQHRKEIIQQVRTTKPSILVVSILALLIAGLIGGRMEVRKRHLRVAAEEGLRKEITENSEGIKEMRAAIPTEIGNVSDTVMLLDKEKPAMWSTARISNLVWR
jgi:hypothetical protein